MFVDKEKATHLNGLSVSLVDVDPNDATLPLGLRALEDVVVLVLLVAQFVQPLEDKFEQRLEVLRRGRRDKDVGVPMGERGSDRKTERGRFSTSSTGSQGDGRREGLGCDRFGEGEDSLGLKVQRGIEREGQPVCPSHKLDISHV